MVEVEDCLTENFEEKAVTKAKKETDSSNFKCIFIIHELSYMNESLGSYRPKLTSTTPKTGQAKPSQSTTQGFHHLSWNAQAELAVSSLFRH